MSAPMCVPLRRVTFLCAVLLQEALFNELPSFFEVIVPRKLESMEKDGHHGHEVSYSVTAEGRTYTLNLTQDRGLVSEDFKLFTYGQDNQLLMEQAYVRQDCYYYGTVEGQPRSLVALSTCHGLRGFLQTENFTYAIEPAEFSSTFQHFIYKLEDVDTEAKRCYMLVLDRTSTEYWYRIMREYAYLYQNSAPREAYVKIHGIMDFDLYENERRNITKSIQDILNVIHLANTMFKPLNIHLYLVSFEIWTNTNLVHFVPDIANFVKSFADWQFENVRSRVKTDVVVLFRLSHINGASGAAYFGEICNPRKASIMVVRWRDPHTWVELAQTLTHQIGHALGMEHDATDFTCPCAQKVCLMHYATNNGIVSFSCCSSAYYEEFLSSGRGFCLSNHPPPKLYYTHAFCGNKLVEGNEKCDCGSAIECATDACCNVNCQLKDGAQCSVGPCCRYCKFTSRGTLCRTPSSECDVAEYCTGMSSKCPTDVIMQDGTPCKNGLAHCVSKTCYDYNKHCRRLFGSSAIVAPRSCFTLVNTVGDRFGNCGFSKNSGTPLKCDEGNVMCGRLQCTNVKKLSIYGSIATTIQTPSGNSMCFGVDNHFTKGTKDIGEVGSGAVCDPGKVCVNRQCVAVSVLNYDCNVQRNCSGRGVCNNLKHCHCNVGWAPPNCSTKGYGGSIDSGPLINGSFITYVPVEEDMLGFEVPENGGHVPPPPTAPISVAAKTENDFGLLLSFHVFPVLFSVLN